MEWLFWVAGALLLIVIETMTADLTFLMIAGGALGGGLTSFLGGPVWAQVVVFACVSTLLLFAVRPSVAWRPPPRRRRPMSTPSSVGLPSPLLLLTGKAGGCAWAVRSGAPDWLPPSREASPVWRPG